MNRKLTLEGLEEMFNSEYGQSKALVGIGVMLPNGGVEIIINHRSNFESKLEYYKNAYNDNLTLKANEKIRIVDYAVGDSFAEIQFEMIGS